MCIRDSIWAPAGDIWKALAICRPVAIPRPGWFCYIQYRLAGDGRILFSIIWMRSHLGGRGCGASKDWMSKNSYMKKSMARQVRCIFPMNASAKCFTTPSWGNTDWLEESYRPDKQLFTFGFYFSCRITQALVFLRNFLSCKSPNSLIGQTFSDWKNPFK